MFVLWRTKNPANLEGCDRGYIELLYEPLVSKVSNFVVQEKVSSMDISKVNGKWANGGAIHVVPELQAASICRGVDRAEHAGHIPCHSWVGRFDVHVMTWLGEWPSC